MGLRRIKMPRVLLRVRWGFTQYRDAMALGGGGGLIDTLLDGTGKIRREGRERG